MRQVLFYVPFSLLGFQDVPVYGYGMMLFLAYVLCSWLAGRLAKREKIDPNLLTDLALWLFGSGILGARLVFVFTEPDRFRNDWLRFFKLWDGGLVFYGSVLGGLVGFFLYYRLYLQPKQVSLLKMVDVVAPCVALGLALGRIGCLMTGCCFGNVAGPECPGICFPVPSAASMTMVSRGHQTAAGFSLGFENARVQFVEPGSAAENAGLKKDDLILSVNGLPVTGGADLLSQLAHEWHKNVRDLRFTVRRGEQEAELESFQAWSIPVHPTQIYESVSMLLMLFFLLSYYPYKIADGSVLVFLMLGYGVHRFLNEMLRTDTDSVAFNMTLSQNISIVVLMAAIAFAVYVFRRPPSRMAIPEAEAPPPNPSAENGISPGSASAEPS